MNWFNSREAIEMGAAFAEQLAPHVVPNPKASRIVSFDEILRRADREVRPLKLNFFKRAKFANSFKWKLIECGVDGKAADEATQALIMHLSIPSRSTPSTNTNMISTKVSRYRHDAAGLLKRGNKRMAEGAYADAMVFYQDAIRNDSRNAEAHNNLGAALSQLGQYAQAENHFRQAIMIRPDLPDAHSNLGIALRYRGLVMQGENSLRRALQLNPRHVDARITLGMALVELRRVTEAKAQLKKALKLAPRNANALYGMAVIARAEGRFDECETMVNRALALNPKLPSAWALLATIRKMTPSDKAWLERADEIIASGLSCMDEVDLRFAMGKYCDDAGEFKKAFENFKRANDLLKDTCDKYDRVGRTRDVDKLIAVYTRGKIADVRSGFSTSPKPVFVIGMMRSGTSLVEQIIASHPNAAGAGELEFWRDSESEHELAMQQGPLGESTRNKLTAAYLQTLADEDRDALRIVDKATVNCDYLGVIHALFPQARIIYMQRDATDVCLSCYFQHFSTSLSFTTDLSDLAHFYREHHRLMTHWRSVLPPGTLLEVPYAGLVEDQARWTRDILNFLGLDWEERCLRFFETERAVLTASFWQVRQKMFKDSLQRWRNYSKFIGPLRSLKDLAD